MLVTGLPNSSMEMAPRLPQSLNITLPSTTLMVLTLMMLRNTSKKKEPLKVILKLRKLNSRIHFHSWKRNVTSSSQLQLRNQFTEETLTNCNVKQLLKVLMVHQHTLEKKSLSRRESLFAQIF
jgi:hypothetical protein